MNPNPIAIPKQVLFSFEHLERVGEDRPNWASTHLYCNILTIRFLCGPTVDERHAGCKVGLRNDYQGIYDNQRRDPNSLIWSLLLHYERQHSR